jgi:hypothetical protein
MDYGFFLTHNPLKKIMRIYIFCTFFIVLLACKSKVIEPSNIKDCINSSPKWSMININSDYQLGFPESYLEGKIIDKNEKGFLFVKNRLKGDVLFNSGYYVNNMIYSYYPNILLKTIPDSVEVIGFKTKYLTNKTLICLKGNIIGVFYWGQLYFEKGAPLKTPGYQEEFGDLYLKDKNNNYFQLAARFDYQKKYHDEIIEILSTLTPTK